MTPEERTEVIETILGPHVTFGKLKVGERFRFPGSPTPLRKVSPRRYVEIYGISVARYTTGSKTAVIPLSPPKEG